MMKRCSALLLIFALLFGILPANAAGEDLSERITVGRVQFYQNEQEIRALQTGDPITVKCEIWNKTPYSGGQDAYLFLQITRNGKVLEVKKAKETLYASGGTYRLSVTSDPIPDISGCEVEAYITADPVCMTPLASSAKLGSTDAGLHKIWLNGEAFFLTDGIYEYDFDLKDQTLPANLVTEPNDQGTGLSVSQENGSIHVTATSNSGIGREEYLFQTNLLKWEDRSSIYRTLETEWPFRPVKDYKSRQNPPDFSWPYLSEATSYDLKICKDARMRQVVYRADALDRNYYNFAVPFETGTYYWSVRYHTESGVSHWTEASRFTILPEATEYTVDSIDTMLSKIPASHPRIAVSQENLEEYRSLSGGKSYIDEYMEKARAYMQEAMPSEPETAEDLRAQIAPMTNRVYTSSRAYLLQPDAEIGAYGVSVLLSLASWDPEGTTSYVNQDQAFRDIMLAMVHGYDYLYDLLTEEQRQTVLSAIRTRAVTLEHPTKGLSDAAYKLKQTPYMSHGGTAQSYLLLTSIALYGELPEAEQWLREYLPMYLNMLPVWGNQDGGWAQGTGYAPVSYTMGEDLRFTLYTHDIANVYRKAFYKNSDKFGVYFAGKYGGAEFGDGSDGTFSPDWAATFKAQAYLLQSPYAAWLRNHCGYGATGNYANYYMLTFPWPTEKSPEELPKAEVFPDIGWVAMHSDMTDYENRISAYFKSSPFGSYNHSHPDQNSFVIQAYGERLAIDSGYYDYYWSPFDLGYTRKTYAHNAVTMDGGIGQAPTAMTAKGNIAGFVHHSRFDLATGDAAEAYNYDFNDHTGSITRTERMEKAKRHLIYLRPDTFLVIDDLKRSGGQTSSFEWWLNALSIASYTNQSASIQQGKAALDAVIQYPAGMTAQYSDQFAGPDGTVYTPSGEYATQPIHQRVWFSTPQTNSTKIIATMSVHPAETAAALPSATLICNVQKLTFADGTIAYIKTDDAQSISAEGIATDAAAILVKEGNYLMADGTFLTVNGTEIFAADKRISAAYGEGELSISCEEDVSVTLGTAGNITTVTTQEGKEIPSMDNRSGFGWTTGTGSLLLYLSKGFYTVHIQ